MTTAYTDTEDKQVQSLDDQKKTMRAAANREGLHIIGEAIRESKSAKRPFVREKFDQLLDDIEAGRIDGIICWKINRLSRNPTDSGRIQQLLQDGILKHIQTAEKTTFQRIMQLYLASRLACQTSTSESLQLIRSEV